MGSCVATLKVEFDEDRRDFDLDEFDGRWVEYFGSSRIVKDRRAYLGVRVTLFASVLAIFVWSITVDALAGDLRCWLIYLTQLLLPAGGIGASRARDRIERTHIFS